VNGLPEQQSLPFSGIGGGPPPRRNLVIEAGAGTGKTTRIVAEVLSLALRDPNLIPERLVLITFTEKAAAEIAERVRDALREITALPAGGTIRWPAGSGTPLIELTGREALDAREAAMVHLQNAERIRSQTIHSFCHGLLRAWAFEAGLDPQFRLLEPFEQKRVYAEIWDAWLAEELRDPDAGAVRAWEILVRGIGGVDRLRAAIFALLPRRDLLADRRYSTGSIDDFVAATGPALEALRSAGPETIDAFKDEPARRVAGYVASNESPPADLDAWISWFAPVRDSLAEIGLRGVPKSLREPLKALRGEERHGKTLLVLLEQHRCAVTMLDAASRFFAALEREKEARGVVDFDDLLFRTLALLREPAVLDEVRSGIDTIFVDEFQDTDRTQAAIVDLLARDSSGHLVPGRLTIVGDPKQSIYGFRRADPETYAATVRTLTAAGARSEYLTDQYRSDPALVDALNTLFVPLFPEGEDADPDVFRASYRPLRGARPAGEERPRLRFIRLAGEESGGLFAEAAAIARWIAIHRGESPLDLRRFAILLRKATHLATWVDALERAGIDSIAPPAESLFESRSVVDLLAVLRAIAVPFDRAAEISAARSSLFALDDDEIAAFFAEGRRAGEAPAWDAFRTALENYRALAGTLTPSELIELLIRDSGVEQAWRAMRRGDEPLDDLARFRAAAAAFDRSPGGSLREFVEEIIRRRSEPSDSGAPPPPRDVNAVRILTVHASKGLEFDTVIIPDLGGGSGREGAEVAAVDSVSSLVVSGPASTLSGTYRESGGRTLREIVREREAEETRRLLYVAVTRAKNDVVFAGDPERLKRDGFWKVLAPILTLPAEAWPEGAGAAARRIATPAGEIEVVFETVPAGEVEPRASSPLRNPSLLPLLERPREAPVAMSPPVPAELPPGEVAAKRAAARKKRGGVILHRILELWDGDASTISGVAAAVVREAGGGEELLRDAVARMRTIARSETARSVFGSGRAMAEVTLHVAAGEGVAEKRIDRLVESGEGYLVVDFKSGKPSAERKAKDREQITAYVEHVRAISGRPCRGAAWYVDLDHDELVEIAVEPASLE
jgi:ATP-dependent helicase/nuclease subunit A